MERLRRLREVLEVQHYARRHADQVVVVAITPPARLTDLLLDLHACLAFSVRLILVAPPSCGPNLSPPAVAVADDPDALAGAWARREVPCVLVQDPIVHAQCLAERLGANRLLCLGRPLPPRRRGQLSPADLPLPSWSEDPTIWSALARFSTAPGKAAVLLDPGPGCVFAELFTHEGFGLMIGHALEEQIRPGRPEDAADIFLLLRDDIARGSIRPVDEQGIAATVRQHLVFSIDGVVVGTARLVPHGAQAELSRFATLPRYRGQGRARELGLALIERARQQGYAGVFALSIEPGMWRLFESLGLQSTPRETLPESWRAGYDLARPSRAYALAFEPPGV